LGVSTRTVSRTRKQYITEGLEQALHDKPRPGQPKKLFLHHEAKQGKEMGKREASGIIEKQWVQEKQGRPVLNHPTFRVWFS
ncbi:hypothetical protein AKJ65_07420, partial [candidate division MSBL1 archaeon SCGC-AAA259E19]